MRRTIHTEHVRTHTLTDEQVKCFKTHGGDGYIAKTGYWIVFNEGEQIRAGRMLGKVYADACGETPIIRGHLSVFCLSNDLTYGYIRWIAPEDVQTIYHRPPSAFLAFITGELPDADLIHKLSAYGTLSESYIHLAEHHMTAWRAGVSPAAYDAGVRGAD